VSTLKNESELMRIRIDVDYPYPSRFRSFLYTALGIRTSHEYLKNAKIIARMINESSRNIKAFWFFTPKTVPDKELLTLINNEKHEVALHIVNDPYSEWKNLEHIANESIRYYTIHGTARVLSRIAWKRWRSGAPKISAGFPLQSFHTLPTKGLDALCFNTSSKSAAKIAEDHMKKGYVTYFHPIWLFQRGKLNHRGPFYEALRMILDVDAELGSISVAKKYSVRIARDQKEYLRNVIPSSELFEKLRSRRVDIFTFLERRWCCEIKNPQKSWVKTNDNIALLQLKTYDEWWKSINKKTRNMVRKAGKSGITTTVAEPCERLVEGVWKIYNETPIRQGRSFPHYGISLHQVMADMNATQDCTYISAYFQDELAGFIQLVHGENITVISQILSLQRHWDKAVNNALVSKAIEVCADRREEWIMYGRMGNHPSLDNFKQSNGFVKFQLTRYYVMLTRKGRVAAKLRMHREIKDSLPPSIKYKLLPLYNWTSRMKIKIRLHLARTK
jgi:hypothetical protein